MSYRDVGLPWLRNLCVLLLDHKEEIFLPFLLHMDLLVTWIIYDWRY
jgi:hypothetical protein